MPAFREECSNAPANAWAFTVGQVAWQLGISVREYRELVDGETWPTFETYDRIEKRFGWPQTFAGGRTKRWL